MESKAHISTRETTHSGEMAIHKEQHLVVGNKLLPDAEEMAKLKEVHPDLPEFCMEIARREQEARHEIQRGAIEDVRKNTDLRGRGMNYALVALILFVALSAFALYLDRPWFAGVFSFASLAIIIQAFVGTKGESEKKSN